MRTVTRIERPTDESRKRVAAYCRVSTEKDAQIESLENQMAAFNMRIAMHPGWVS